MCCIVKTDDSIHIASYIANISIQRTIKITVENTIVSYSYTHEQELAN